MDAVTLATGDQLSPGTALGVIAAAFTSAFGLFCWVVYHLFRELLPRQEALFKAETGEARKFFERFLEMLGNRFDVAHRDMIERFDRLNESIIDCLNMVKENAGDLTTLKASVESQEEELNAIANKIQLAPRGVIHPKRTKPEYPGGKSDSSGPERGAT